MQILPAILPPAFEDITANLTKIKGITSSVQIDLCDGILGAEKTWLPSGKEMLPPEFSYEFDMMVRDWKIPVAQCLLLKATSIIVHVDNFSDDDIDHLVKMVIPYNVSLGVSVSNDKDVHTHIEMVHKVKKLYKKVFIQVMGIRHIGQQGQPFDERVPLRVITLRHEFRDTRIQVDGGVNLKTIKALKDAGADSVIAGSAIFKAVDAKTAYEGLLAVVA